MVALTVTSPFSGIAIIAGPIRTGLGPVCCTDAGTALPRTKVPTLKTKGEDSVFIVALVYSRHDIFGEL